MNAFRDENANQDAQAAADAAELARFGYAQQLRRTMGAFSSFAIAFSLISIITGIFANFTFGFRQVGPAVIWSWSVVALGQLLVALVLADLSTRIPLSGYGYQWSTRLVNPHFGYFVGWLLLMQFLTGFPGVCHALATALCSWAIADESAALWVPWVAVAVVSVIALVHLFGIKLVAIVNDLGVIAELIAGLVLTAGLLGLYLWRGGPDLSFLLDRTSPISGAPAGVSAFALSLLMGAWCLTGFEAAADLAEETHRPRHVIPRVILTAEISSAVCGFFLLAGLILGIEDAAATSQQENMVTAILGQRLGNTWMPLVMLVVLVSILACGVASMAATTRLVFSLARDNMLPFSGVLKSVHQRLGTPAGAIVLVWAVSNAVILGFGRLEIITSISAAAGFLGYAGIVWASFRARGHAEGFSLGKLQTPLRLAALIWTLTVVAALTIPDSGAGSESIAHLPAKSTLAACAMGGVIYAAIVRRRIARGEAGPPPHPSS
ncbi:MAG: amino acid permease [Planctomycetota bacterium]|nr:MAG: amino acid permease [Planctomycetota bacterium]